MAKAKPQVADTDVAQPNTAFDNIPEQFVPLNQIGVAPENLRAAEGPDEEIPQLAETLFVGGQVFALLVRPGRGKSEEPFMALDGRRRRFGFLALAADGRIPVDHPVRVKVLTDPALQIAAAMLPNTEHVAPDLVDVIAAVGRLQRRKMSPTEIARALGYTLKDIQGWAALADLDKAVLVGLRDGRITLKQAKLMTKLTADDQRQLAEHARTYGSLYDHLVRQRVDGAVITLADRRVRLAGLDNYRAAGGRVESDLFGELPDTLLDQPILQQVWDAQAQAVVELLRGEGLDVFVGGFRGQIPEGYRSLPYVYSDERSEEDQAELDALEARASAAQSAVSVLAEVTAETRRLVLEAVTADLDYRRGLHTETLAAATILPHPRLGVEVVFHIVDAPEPDVTTDVETEDDTPTVSAEPGVRRHGDVDIPRVELDGSVSTHALNERYTDVATRGLIRAVADDPQAALILVVARLFANAALTGSGDKTESISTLQAEAYRRYGAEPIPALDGDVVDRLEAHRQAYLAAGVRPIPWVASLSHGERMSLLAELVGMTLNGREFATHAKRHGARAEALEVTDLTGYDILNYWTPDLEFFAAHNKKQLLAMTEAMGGDVAPAAALKKGDLAAYVTEGAAEHRWAPEALSWRKPVDVSDEADAETAAADDAGQPEAAAA
ncbi:MAG TPA: chromosome partitioning protein ParB [Phenylobacterium sp.]